MLRTVASFRDPWEAHFLRLRLEADGVPAVVAHEHHVWMYWPYSVALGGVKVQVPRSAVAEALAVQERCRSGQCRAELAAELGGLDDPCCPACGSQRFTARSSIPMLIVALLATFWAGAVMPARASIRRCKACGTGWRDGLHGVRLLGRPATGRSPVETRPVSVVYPLPLSPSRTEPLS